MPFVPGFNIFTNPSDRMHQLDHGVFLLMKELVVDYIKLYYTQGSLQLFDRRWASLARAPGLKVFHRGVSTLSFVACFENRVMGMGLPFVLRGMDRYHRATADVHVCLQDVTMSYLALRWLVAHDSLSDLDLDTLYKHCEILQQKIDKLHAAVHGASHDRHQIP